MDARRWMVAVVVPLLLTGCDVADEPTGEVTASESPTVEPTETEPTEAEPTATGAAESGDELPGDYAEIIASESDCSDLQEIFDTADNAAQGRRDAGDVEEAEQFTAVMVAADERMREVGCYD